MSLQFDYEFIFSSGAFEQAVYDACNIPDILGGRQAAIEDTVREVQKIFDNKFLNLNKFSTFIEYGNKNYRVTVSNPTV
jgi:hypothetical protein